MTSKFNELAQQILAAKYYAPGEKTPEDLFNRVAMVASIPDVIDALCTDIKNMTRSILDEFTPYIDIAVRVCNRRNITILSCSEELSIEEKARIQQGWVTAAQKYYDAMVNMEFMPATPTLISAGRGGMLSSCFFLRIDDTMESIFDTVKKVAIISQRGGGVGLDFSFLRPAGAPVSKTNGYSSGPISFMKVFHETGNQVKGGGIRRAAMMAMLRVDHPDILDFITCKEKEGELSNFNISVLVTDAFMQAVHSNGTITLQHEKAPIKKEIKAKKIWDLLVANAHNNGEPGVVFIDTVNKADVFKGKHGGLGLNPCSELNLLEGESCILAAINLASCYTEGDSNININKLQNLVRLGIRFLDNVVDLNSYPLPEIEEKSLMTRRIGLGTMGLHDLLLKLGIAYGHQSITTITDIYSIIKSTAEEESMQLGNQRGVPQALRDVGLIRRNAGVLTVQPTGTISIICGASSGIEPVFEWEYTRKDSFGTHHIKHFMLDHFTTDTMPAYAQTALEISPIEHIEVQAAVQKYIDSAISKTINAPNSATSEDIDNIYRLAYQSGCKSTTVYRSGSRQEEVLVKKPENAQEEIQNEITQIDKDLSKQLRERPRVLFGATYRYNSSGGKLYVTISEDKYGVREVFINVSRAGSEVKAHVEATGRLISNSLKYGIPLDVIIGHLKGQKSSPVLDHGRWILSVPDAVAQAMAEYHKTVEGFSEYIEDPLVSTAMRAVENTQEPITADVEPSGELCIDCGENMAIREGGCLICRSCGYERCGG